jgi:polar amino acid transport system substrate-binding protein
MKWKITSCLVLLLFLPAKATQAIEAEPLVIAVVEGISDSVASEAVLLEAYRRLGVVVEFRPMGAVEALQASSSGAVDAELHRIDGINLEFPDLVQVPIPINYLMGAAFSIEFDFRANGWRSLQHYRIGVVEGIIFSTEGTAGFDVTVVKNYDQLFDMLSSGQVDVAVTPRINGLYMLRKRGLQNTNQGGEGNSIQEMEGILEILLLYHYVHKSRSDLVPGLTEILGEMLRDGTTRKIRDQSNNKLLSE